MVCKSRHENSGHDRPRPAKAAGQRKGEELGLVAHFARSNQGKAAEDGVPVHGHRLSDRRRTANRNQPKAPGLSWHACFYCAGAGSTDGGGGALFCMYSSITRRTLVSFGTTEIS